MGYNGAIRRKGPVTDAEKQTFLDALAAGQIIEKAAQAAGRSRHTLRDLKRRDEEFSAQWDEAYDMGTEAMEDHLNKVSIDGWDEVMEEYGPDGDLKRKTVNHRWQPTPLIFALKARKPEKYRDNATVQVTGAEGGPVLVEGYSPPTLAEIVRLAVELGVAGVIEGEASEDAIIELEEGQS